MIILFLLKDGSIKTFEINGISVNGILKLITFDRVDHCIDFNLFILTNDKSLFLDCQLDTPALLTCDHIGSMKSSAELAAFCRLLAFANKFSIFFAKVLAYTNSARIFVLPNAMKRAGKKTSNG